MAYLIDIKNFFYNNDSIILVFNKIITCFSKDWLLEFSYVTIILLLISLTGIFLLKKNIIIILMAIEVMFLAINLNFISSSYFLSDISGQIMSIFILTVAAAESAIGLALVILFYRTRGIISVDFINSIKG